MHLIAHRANFNGRKPMRENTIAYIDEALDRGYDVELDVWSHQGAYYLGHDEAEHEVTLEYLLRHADRFWVHCKNFEALSSLLQEKQLNCFFHDKDAYTITSKHVIWAYPGQPIDSNTVCVMPEWHSLRLTDIQQALGVCSDDLRPFS